MKRSAVPTLFCAIAVVIASCDIQPAVASLADEAIAKGDELFNKAVGLSRQGDHVESACSFVKARAVYGKYLRCRARFRECNKLLAEELKKHAEIVGSRGDLELHRKIEEAVSKILQSDAIAFSDESKWREQPIKLYQDAYNQLCESKPSRSHGGDVCASDVVRRTMNSRCVEAQELRTETSLPRNDYRHAKGTESRPKGTTSPSTFNDSLFKTVVLVFGVVLPLLLLVRSKRRNKTKQALQTTQASQNASSALGQFQPPAPAPASTAAPVATSKKTQVYSFEEQSVRDFVELCRVRGMPSESTYDFRLSGGECVYGRMEPAALFETISATNLNMRHISTGTLYATSRRFVYVVGGDVRVFSYNDVIKFESTNLFGSEGSVSVALASRRKRMEFYGPNSFMISMAFGYVTDPDIRNLLQSLSIAAPNDPGIEILVQKLLSCQTHPSDESSGLPAGCLSSLFSLAMGAAVVFGIYKVICWMISTAKVN